MKFGRALLAARSLLALSLLVFLTTGNATGAGNPVTITIGYQPYYTGAWGALVVKEQELWKKYLPPGSVVNWEVGLQGAVITNNMLAGKYQFGYVGDMPGIVATTKRSDADLRLLMLASYENQQCNLFVVRPDAPQFKTPSEAVKWMAGKRVAVPKGSCTDRFAREVFAREKVEPGEYLNQSIEVITTNLRAGKLDAAVIWEPNVAHVGTVVGNLSARLVGTGADWDLYDSALLVGSKEFVDKNPEIAIGLLRAEIDAEKFIVSKDPKNACLVAEYALKNTIGYEKKQMWYAMYGQPTVGKSIAKGVRWEAHVVFDAPVRDFLKKSSDFLLEAKVIDKPMPADAIFDVPLTAAMKAANVTGPLGAVKRSPVSAYPCA